MRVNPMLKQTRHRPPVSWRRSDYLQERLAALNDGADLPPVNDTARQRARSWLQQTPFNQQIDFEQRLAHWGVDSGQWPQLLAVSNPGDDTDPIVEAYEALCDDKELPVTLTDFSDLFAPLVIPQVRTLDKYLLKLDPQHQVFAADSAQQLFAPMLSHQLVQLSYRALILELNVARLNEALHGSDGQERFQDYLRWQSQPQRWRAFLNEYAVLTRRLIAAAKTWFIVCAEFAERLVHDMQYLRGSLLSGDPGHLCAVQDGAGDNHRGGRSVMLLRFSDDSRVVYKPRSLAVDVAFQGLLSWLNQHLPGYHLAIPKVVDCDTHGWASFVVPASCADSTEVAWFYRRMGAFMAVFYLLDTTDLHYENIIADGAHPRFCDLETLYHPRVDSADEHFADQPFAHTTPTSVIRAMLLPGKIGSGEGRRGYDLSGLGADDTDSLPAERICGWNTDEMCLEASVADFKPEGHRPRLGEHVVHSADYLDDLLTGFTAVYETCRRQRQTLLGDDSPLIAFESVTIRCVLRPTRVYSLLLGMASHPDYLRDATAQDQLFDKLWLDAVHRPFMARLINAEQAELRVGDVPVFTTTPTSRDLTSGQGWHIPNVFHCTTMARVRYRIAHLDDQRLAAQCWTIRSAFALSDERPDIARACHYVPTRQQTPLTAARDIGNWILQHAVYRDEAVYWIGLAQPSKNDKARCEWLANDLYRGRVGIALFTAAMYHLDEDRQWLELTRRCLDTVAMEVTGVDNPSRSVREPVLLGGFDGWGGMVYGIAMASQLIGSTRWLPLLHELIARLASRIQDDDALDVISGSAGVILALDAVRQIVPDPLINKVIRRAADRLVSRVHHDNGRYGWPVIAQQPLVGFAHGNAGMIAALAVADREFPQAGYDAVLEHAWNDEDSQYSVAMGGWPCRYEAVGHGNNQSVSNAVTVPVNWCYGASGIGIARWRMLQQQSVSRWRARAELDLRRAVEAVMARPALTCDALCHGAVGNAQLLRLAADYFDDQRVARHGQQQIAEWVQRVAANGYRCGSETQLTEPGLMVGLAGIGYGLLNLVSPAGLPEVLALAPARGAPV